MGQSSIELTHGVRRPAALRLLTDDRLARRAAEGDRGAFAVIFERHHQGLYRYCRAILRHDEDARDALQTTFTRAIAALDGDTRSVAIRPWLYRIAHNEAITLLRRRRPVQQLDLQPEAASRAPGPDDRVLASERTQQLLEDLEQLPERQRWALLLRELNDLAYDDIAAAISTTEQAARQSVYEARVMLLELQEGREMPCEEVRRLISERDGRLLRPRRVRAHLRACNGCSSFRAAIGTRRSQLGALAPPLPAAAAAALLSSLLGGGGGGGWGGGGLLALLGAGKGAVAGAGSKGVATAAALTIAGGALVTTGGTIQDPGGNAPHGKRPAAVEKQQNQRAVGPSATTHLHAAVQTSVAPVSGAIDLPRSVSKTGEQTPGGAAPHGDAQDPAQTPSPHGTPPVAADPSEPAAAPTPPGPAGAPGGGGGISGGAPAQPQATTPATGDDAPHDASGQVGADDPGEDHGKAHDAAHDDEDEANRGQAKKALREEEEDEEKRPARTSKSRAGERRAPGQPVHADEESKAAATPPGHEDERTPPGRTVKAEPPGRAKQDVPGEDGDEDDDGPGCGGGDRGRSEDAPGRDDDAPGKSGEDRGRGDDAPGKSDDGPGKGNGKPSD